LIVKYFLNGCTTQRATVVLFTQRSNAFGTGVQMSTRNQQRIGRTIHTDNTQAGIVRITVLAVALSTPQIVNDT